MFATYVIPSGRISLKKMHFLQVTHTCIHLAIRPYLNSTWEIMKTSHVQIFFCCCFLSLVFICRENPRPSGILLFPDRPRFCRLMKTRNRRYPRLSTMNGDKSGESGAFLFSRRVPDFCDGRRSFPTNENSNLYLRGRRCPSARRWISLVTNPLNCWAPVPLSQIIWEIWDNPLANIRYIGKIWDGRQKVNPRSSGIFPTYENQA